MLLKGGEARGHRVEANVRCTQGLPLLRLAHLLIRVAIFCIHLRLDTNRVRIAARLLHIGV